MVESDFTWPLVAALVVLVLAVPAEWLHARRIRRLAPLAFGPKERPSAWALSAPWVRVISMSAVAWGLATLLLVTPKRYSNDHTADDAGPAKHHVLIALDVSPSIRLVDAGPQKNESRMMRARELMESFFDRVPIDEYRVSVVAFYNGAKSVVVDTKDFEVVRNILGDLPMHFAFPAGKTKLFDGLEEAARIAKPWDPRSTVLIVLSDGNTVPATGMPKMPDSIRSVLVIGVGDPDTGKFIDGAQSRQDIPTMKQVAARLGGTFFNGNDRQIASSLIAEATGAEAEDVFQQLTRREYALLAVGVGSALLAFLPLLLHFFGTKWNPGTSVGARDKRFAADLTRYPRSEARIG